MNRVLKIQKLFISQYLKQILEYKGDFCVGVLGVGLTQGLNLLFLEIVFTQVPNLKGWSFKELVFIYGFSLIPKGIDHLFFDNLWAISQRLVIKGEFDKYLTRPINPLFHVLIETFQVDAIGEIAIGILLLLGTFDIINWTSIKIFVFIITIPFATLIFTSLKIITSSLAFWMKQSGSVTFIFYMMNDFAKYPTTIYNAAIRFTITFIIPFAFTAFYPASYILNGNGILFKIGGLITISSVLLIIALLIWNKGVSAYESAGS